MWLLVGACTLSSCTQWRPASIAPGVAAEPVEGGRVRLTLRDGTRVELRNHSVYPDSLVGITLSEYGERTRVAVPAGDVVRIERAEFSRTRTRILAAGIAAAGVAVVYVVRDVLNVIRDPSY